MTKRAYKKFKRNERSFYETPKEAVYPLVRYLKDIEGANCSRFEFVEPCAGHMALARHIRNISDGAFQCSLALDIRGDLPRCVQEFDSLNLTKDQVVYSGASKIITNPPWDRKILHPMIEVFSDICDTFLLFDADWIHTKQSIPFLPRLRTIISIGRVKWIADSDSVGFDNAAWYRFGLPLQGNKIEFVGRKD